MSKFYVVWVKTFKRSTKIQYFQKKNDFYDFGWMFSALLFRRMSQRIIEDEYKSVEILLTKGEGSGH